MAESKSDPSSNSSPGKDVKAPNVFERAKEEFEAVLHNGLIGHRHHKETHGLRQDIDINTSMSDVKAPNVIERAKEEIEALVEAFHPKKDSKTPDSPKDSTKKDCLKSEKSEPHSEKNVQSPKATLKDKKETESPKHKPHQSRETHGLREDIDENTPISAIKGPSMFERAKEEIEAIVDAFHPKKDENVAEKKDTESPKSKPHHHEETHGLRDDIDENTPISSIKAPSVFERAKEEIEALVGAFHPKKDDNAPKPTVEDKKETESLKCEPHHRKETHGLSDDIDENTPISAIKGPSVFERAKEEIEALVDAFHPKKDSGNAVSSPKN